CLRLGRSRRRRHSRRSKQLLHQQLIRLAVLDQVVIGIGVVLVDGRGVGQPRRLVPAGRDVSDDDGVLKGCHC
ncbi:hypothetical protein PENTCL1PPCAC_30815, partial [Pristionchus entomophagus]